MSEAQKNEDIDILQRDIPNKIDSRFLVEHTFTTTSEESFEHNLNKIPNGFIVVSQSKHATIIGDKSKWTSRKIFLTSSASDNIVSIVIF